jgi:hypothetical protein
MAKRRAKTRERIGFGVRDALQQRLAAFRHRFGRDPGPDDPVFFDPRSDTPFPIDFDELQCEMVTLMLRVRIRPELIYAYLRTGLMVTHDNQRYISAEDLDGWNRAIIEYSRHGR